MYKNGGEEVKWFILNDVWIHIPLQCCYKTPVGTEIECICEEEESSHKLSAAVVKKEMHELIPRNQVPLPCSAF